MDQRDRYRSTPPQRTADDMPLAAYGGTGMEDEATTLPDTEPAREADASPPTMTAAAAAPGAAAAGVLPDAVPVPDDEPPGRTSVLARLVHLFRTSRLAAGAGFAVVIVVGLILLSSGGASPGATAATPTNGPTAAPTLTPPSGEAAITLSGAVEGTFPVTGQAGGQHVDATSVALGWADPLQTTLSIAGPLDRGTRTTDERLVLTIGVLVDGQPVTFTSTAGECTIGMASVGTKVQGSFSCRKLKSADGKLTIEASGTYRT
jgi:hypothetical protein